MRFDSSSPYYFITLFDNNWLCDIKENYNLLEIIVLHRYLGLCLGLILMLCLCLGLDPGFGLGLGLCLCLGLCLGFGLGLGCLDNNSPKFIVD